MELHCNYFMSRYSINVINYSEIYLVNYLKLNNITAKKCQAMSQLVGEKAANCALQRKNLIVRREKNWAKAEQWFLLGKIFPCGYTQVHSYSHTFLCS